MSSFRSRHPKLEGGGFEQVSEILSFLWVWGPGWALGCFLGGGMAFGFHFFEPIEDLGF